MVTVAQSKGTEVATLRCARDLCYNSMLSEYPSEPSCHSEALAACAFLLRRKFSSSSPSTAERKDFQQEAIRTVLNEVGGERCRSFS